MGKARQKAQKLYGYITVYMNDHTYAPSYQEMSAFLQISKSGISRYIGILESEGLLTQSHSGNKSTRTRTIVLVGHNIHFTHEEWHSMHAAWGDDIKDNILEAAGQTRFQITA